ncbi:hypothetical protein LJC07_00680 [Christensenellaceae bacterium OttesenSCG-928-L17]|nr:hypothetical protein [Christensenellaceae bacterium OttesenSCG-928-L17]
MKNHVRVDGKLLQTNKKWTALKQSQRTWIYDVTAEVWTAYVERAGKLPMKKKKEEVIDAVYARVVERDIWIPYSELKQAVNKKIDRLNRKSPLFRPPNKPEEKADTD